MITTEQIQTLLSNGAHVVGQKGDKLGKVSHVYLDDETGRPEWATIEAGGLFGGSESFVPLADASLSGDEIVVPWDKAKVKNAPDVKVDDHGHISEDQEATLYEYYGMTSSSTATGQVGHDTTGPNTDDAMTRSEEQVRVGTEKVASGKARLRKFVVTENVTTTVPVSREEVRLVTEPITDDNRGDAMSGGDITSEEHEVTLHEERPVVQKDVVPVERVRLDTETVTEEQQVTEQVRKEQIESDLSDAQPLGRPKRDK